MKVLLIGCGGREAIIAKLFSKDLSVELYAAIKYKNPSIINLCKSYIITEEKNIELIFDFAKYNSIDLVFVGSETSLSYGIVDLFSSEKINIIGPLKCCSKLETDKAWARKFIDKYNIGGNPEYNIFKSNEKTSLKFALEYINKIGDVAIKPIGITGGKGVKVIGEQLQSIKEAETYISHLLKETDIIIEKKLIGEEFTLQAFTDGDFISFCPVVQDHKKLLNMDKGENTGGMGSYTDSNGLLPFLTIDALNISKKIMSETIKYISIETGHKYKGILYGQFMLTNNNEIKLIEYNVRFGDPEAINILSLLKTNFLDICISIINGSLDILDIYFEKMATVCKYLVPLGYPNNSKTNDEIVILSNFIDNVDLFFANVNIINKKIYTTNSRSVAIIGFGDSIYEAEKKVENYMFKNVRTNLYYRKDIGTKELINSKLNGLK